uniref:GDSL esterase/lipase At5g45920-like n=1 Tax=Fragaria vesca subsp. vesca TaxID=101020 RepID=UPI0005C98E94|nr:PREDICTED: GDSL esterase/lipase At5g45920-like [Fragaria vesca subsp. vesca]
MRPKIYLFGDSITEESFGDGGWGASLAHHFSRNVDVVLRGYSGYNTRWAEKVLKRVFPGSQDSGGEAPLAVTVFFGANDACLLDRCSGFLHVPVDEYKHNLRSIVSFLKKQWPATRVILITPPPIDEEGRLQYGFTAYLVFSSIVTHVHLFSFFFESSNHTVKDIMNLKNLVFNIYLFGYRFPYIENPLNQPERTNEAAGAFAEACVAVARESGLPVIDLWTKMQQVPDWQKAHLRDGLHLTPLGNRFVFEEVVAKLRDEGLSLESLPVDLPLIADIDPNDPLKAFHK